MVEKSIFQHREGKYRAASDTINEAERLQPGDKTVLELKRKLTVVAAITELEEGTDGTSALMKLAINRYMENDPRRAVNALLYARATRASPKPKLNACTG